MPSFDSITSLSELASFIGSFISYIWDSIGSLWDFITRLFNIPYYTEIFSHLPNPFSTIMISIVGFVFVIILMKVIKLFLDIIPLT